MNKGYINIVLIFFISILLFIFTIFIIYSHISIVIYNIRNDLFYLVQNSIISFSEDELGLKKYSYNKERLIADIDYLLDKHYNNNNLSNNIIKNAKIKELKFLEKNEKCLHSKNINNERIHIVIEVTVVPPILKGKLKIKNITLHEDVKFSLMEI